MSQPATTPSPDLAARYQAVRAATERLAAPLSPEDCTAQSMPDASPVKWHLGHTSWFFETFVLESTPGYRPLEPAYRVLFNSYYHAVGEQHFRPERGLITRPGLAEVLAYRRHVDEQCLALLGRGALSSAQQASVELGLQHEQQHQELILTDVKHLFARNPMHPVYRQSTSERAGEAAPLTWHTYPTGLREIGHAGPGFGFDNEGPRHRVFVHAFALGSRLVSNAEFAAFVEDRGYARPELWLSDGFAAVQREGWQAPLYWRREGGAWHHYTLAGLRVVAGAEPVAHVSAYEADAYARWAGARLPTEAEWEVVAAGAPVAGNFVESGRLRPAAALGSASLGAPSATASASLGSASLRAPSATASASLGSASLRAPSATASASLGSASLRAPSATASASLGSASLRAPSATASASLGSASLRAPSALAPAGGPHPLQLFGDVWEWTASAYAPYPGYRPPPGALGEYNGKFMANQLVLRGGSCATPASHMRASYRNFFHPEARWQWSGLRLARDAS